MKNVVKMGMFFPSGSLFSVVEIVDDIEILHGHINGIPALGKMNMHKSVYEVYEIDNQTKSAYVRFIK